LLGKLSEDRGDVVDAARVLGVADEVERRGLRSRDREIPSWGFEAHRWDICCVSAGDEGDSYLSAGDRGGRFWATMTWNT